VKPVQRCYLAVVVVAAAAVAVVVVRGGVPDPGALVVFGALAIGAEAISVRLPSGVTASVLAVPVMAAVTSFGGAHLVGGLVAGFAGLEPSHLRQRRFDRVAFNAAQLLLAGVAAGAVFGALAGPAGRSVPGLLLGTLPAGLAFLVVNVVLLVPMLVLDGDRSARSVLAELNPFHAHGVPFSLVGAGLGWLYAAHGSLVVPFAALPVVIGRQTFASYLALRQAHEGTLRMLVRALEHKDPYTAGHIERVATYARYMGEEFRLSEVRQERLRYAALMHDIGKLVVPNRLLNKPDLLTAEEYEEIRVHERVSVDLLSRIDFLRPIAAAASPRYARFDARAPHHRRDPVEPYIIVVADAYDAMTSTRAYRQALPQSLAFAELRRQAGTQFHPECVEALIRAVERRGERHGFGFEDEITLFDAPPPLRGTGSAGLGDLAPSLATGSGTAAEAAP
jgi:HD superfamily phosphodiesterase